MGEPRQFRLRRSFIVPESKTLERDFIFRELHDFQSHRRRFGF